MTPEFTGVPAFPVVTGAAGVWHASEDFPIPCTALRCSLICRLYFYPPPGLLRLRSAPRGRSAEGTPSVRPEAPIKDRSAGDGVPTPPGSLPVRLFSG